MSSAGGWPDTAPAKAVRTVLVVEDETAIRDLLRLHLCNAGHRVLVAEDAIAAGKLLLDEAESIDVVLIDVQLPHLDGVEFASTLIADSTLPPLQLILITGHEHLLPRAERLGVPCLVKPFTAERLLAAIDACFAVEAPPVLSVASLKSAKVKRHA
jgi:two-component system phosphate regulon response regulator PhoB